MDTRSTRGGAQLAAGEKGEHARLVTLKCEDAGTGMVLEGKYDDGKSCVKVNRPIPWPHASAKEDQPFLVKGD